MKDGLVSRQDVMCRMIKYGFHAPDMTVHEFVEDELPSASMLMVPLDKLCEWLAGNAWHLDCSDCDAEHCDCPQWHDDSGGSPAFWKAKLTKWMEGGMNRG